MFAPRSVRISSPSSGAHYKPIRFLAYTFALNCGHWHGTGPRLTTHPSRRPAAAASTDSWQCPPATAKTSVLSQAAMLSPGRAARSHKDATVGCQCSGSSRRRSPSCADSEAKGPEAGDVRHRSRLFARGGTGFRLSCPERPASESPARAAADYAGPGSGTRSRLGVL